ncbi:MAG: cupin domain-containing protein [Gammaproteobacteria bacterium]|jgi:mannose-6-phosphate isomerase-like protein (cupin superfamily)|nr:cupin domain-containing protein [Gammaproteobacteria bacterium]MDP6731488.1 cupin domain-containing protein [Gammaproteobacteria bacterium]
MRSKSLTHLATAAVFFLLATPSFAQAQTNATHIPSAEIATVYENLGDTIDQQIRVVDIGDDINVAVGVLQRVTTRTEGEEVTAILHHRVTEVYYVLSGSGILVTGGDVTNPVEFPADVSAVRELIGPSGSRTVTNGQTQTISAGDIVVIPAGVPHGFRHIQEQITYLSIRVDPDQTLPTGYAHPSLEQ